MLPNFPKKLIKFGVMVQNDEMHKVIDYFSSVVIYFKCTITLLVRNDLHDVTDLCHEPQLVMTLIMICANERGK